MYEEEVKTQKLDLMPGFRFRWWYTGTEVTPDNIYTKNYQFQVDPDSPSKDYETSKHFVR